MQLVREVTFRATYLRVIEIEMKLVFNISVTYSKVSWSLVIDTSSGYLQFNLQRELVTAIREVGHPEQK